MRNCSSFGLPFSLVIALTACGSAKRTTEPRVPVAALSSAAAAPPEAPSVAAEVSKPAAPGEVEASSDPTPKTEAKAAPDPNALRDVTYVVVPEGLKVTVAGVKFLASTEAQQAAGGWGVKVSVEATADDGHAHSLSKPKLGPLAFAGSVTRKGKSEVEHFGDERAGDGDEAVTGERAVKISRTWPMKGVRALAIGDALDLQVALWGLGTDADSRRPVKRFFHVRMQVDRGKPKAVVEPPASAGGN